MGNQYKAASIKNIATGKAISTTIEGKTIGLFNIDGKIYAVDNECTHAGAPLCEGEIKAATVICPWHGAQFDLSNGEALNGPACEALKSYKVTIHGDDVMVEI